MSLSDLRKLSREQLTGYWGKAIGVTLIYFVISAILQEFGRGTNYITTIFQSLVLTFFSLGMISFYLNVTKKTAQISDIFSQSKVYVKAVVIALIQSALSIAIFIASIATYNEKNETLLAIFGIIIFIFSIAIIIISLMFALSTTILVDNPEISVMDALKESIRLMKGNKIRYILMYLSFIGWLILAALTLGIGFLWLGPYVQMTTVNFYLDLKNKKAQI